MFVSLSRHTPLLIFLFYFSLLYSTTNTHVLSGLLRAQARAPPPSKAPTARTPAHARAWAEPPSPSAATAQGFSLASPRPGGGPPSGRPTSELLGSATFQTPEGAPLSMCPFLDGPSEALTPADAMDQWFENFHHYEVTLV